MVTARIRMDFLDEYSYLTDSLLYEGRVFYGQVLDNKKGVIWYQKTLKKNGHSRSGYVFARPANPYEWTFSGADASRTGFPATTHTARRYT